MDADPFVGQQLAQYNIEEHVGQGGMGSVYRAWDTHLRRRVAIKVLRTSLEKRAAEMRARLLVEARSAAGLNHPNIVTIYEIGRTETLDYIAMEFVQGKTLHSLIAGQPMPLNLALNYGAQIADAVSAAHATGVTHRDLKPANIMITERGRLKVLDFGLAKLAEPADESGATQTLELTVRGSAVGTPSYMSPEQAQGKAVDSRSDIFALGAILYEMLTGRRAFPGDSLAAVMAAILMVEPPPISTVREVPPELDRLIARCLRKDVERRLQHAGDLKIALQEFAAEADAAALPLSSSGVSRPAFTIPPTSTQHSAATSAALLPSALSTGPVPAAAEAPTRRRWPTVVAIVAAVSGLAAAGWLYWTRPLPNPFAGAELFRITADTGLAVSPALSRDGRLIAYASDRANQSNLQIWVQQVAGGGAPIQLTTGDSESSEPSFSPDGNEIVFRSEREGGGIFRVPALGGEARMVARQGRRPRFSPDGQKIAYTVGATGRLSKIFIMDAKGEPDPKPFHPEFATARSPVWSPDGKSILFVALRQKPNSAIWQTDWYIAPVAGGAAEPVGAYDPLRKLGVIPDDPAAWIAGNRVLASGTREAASTLWLFTLPRSPGKMDYPTHLTFGTSMDQDPAITGDTPESFKVAFASLEQRVDLWSIPIDPNRGTITGSMTRLTEGRGTTANQLTVSADGRRISYLSDRAGKSVPWVMDLQTGKTLSVTAPGDLWVPHISPDGKSLAWSIYEEGQATRTLRAAIGADGQVGLPELLCDPCGPVISWSADGRKVVYAHGSPSRAAILDLDTGKRRDLLVKPDMDVWGGRFSPDGRWLTMNVTPTFAQSQIFIARYDPDRQEPVPVSEWIPMTDGQAWDDKSRWAPDGKSMYFVSERDGFRCIWRQPLDPATMRPVGAPQSIRHFHEARLSLRNVLMGPLAIQVTRDRLIVSLGERTGNIWLLRQSRP
jgi:serine/threonine protein kinase/Tol biopolymer transport system component